MALYENPEIPEGINVTAEHPLKDFVLLLLAATGILLAAVLALSLLAGYLVRYVPFAQEQALASRLSTEFQRANSDASKQKQAYLQALANRLAANMDLPKDMSITVHYSTDKTVNAMATLGGNIIIFQGLIDVLPNENALAMVMAHEIAHVRNRHPIVALGRGFAVLLAISSLTGVGDELMQRWVSNMSMITLFSFSRSQEHEADVDALQALLKTYGHVEGAAAFFEYAAKQPRLELTQLLSTHPGLEDRVAQIQQFAQEHDAAGKHELRALPDFIMLHEPQAPATATCD
ncbi:MAG: M48 family metallopeptidase [Gallionella sp.]|nr:M48 family metallopeptidase [Gallionella sp.]